MTKATLNWTDLLLVGLVVVVSSVVADKVVKPMLSPKTTK